MTALLIDIGNARIKWARLESDELQRVQSAPHHGDVVAATDAIRADLNLEPREIIVANVAGSAMAKGLTAAALAEGAAEPRFVASKSEQCGIHNAYAEPHRLGVDRWAAMIAGHALSQSQRIGAPFCIIDAGTAVTFDAVRGDGQHLGGLILAGPRLQAESLAERTSDIGTVTVETLFPGDGLSLLGRSTSAAVAHGAWLAIAGALTRACEALARAETAQPIIYLCGGHAVSLRAWLGFATSLRENLVLEGLALIRRAEEHR